MSNVEKILIGIFLMYSVYWVVWKSVLGVVIVFIIFLSSFGGSAIVAFVRYLTMLYSPPSESLASDHSDHVSMAWFQALQLSDVKESKVERLIRETSYVAFLKAFVVFQLIYHNVLIFILLYFNLNHNFLYSSPNYSYAEDSSLS